MIGLISQKGAIRSRLYTPAVDSHNKLFGGFGNRYQWRISLPKVEQCFKLRAQILFVLDTPTDIRKK